MLDKPSDKDQQAGHCSDCGCTFSQSEPDSTSTSSPPNQQQTLQSRCPSCQAGGSLSNGRRPHRRLRLDPHICSLCNKTFISSAHLNLHLASHNKERKFGCSTCGKLFHQASHLMAHKIIHSGDRPFKCPDCGKTFGRASHLKTHSRLHTGLHHLLFLLLLNPYPLSLYPQKSTHAPGQKQRVKQSSDQDAGIYLDKNLLLIFNAILIWSY
ncbi:gastrula zinc finger protein XlCGF67.1-like isoform X2 [Limanda limanda]|uniref:gastrula zinc finger protein XlCGF67.1-like isoform X2 n=1 Tax=Limanda limanda TaxID=27771 RepID=UPI0029C6F32D|nr:gastrula zinc finger protein XlCGF67.1-like isoform X2 [Limanda limanda]